MNQPPEYYIQQVYSIKDGLTKVTQLSGSEYEDKINAEYQKLSLMNTELINIINTVEPNDATNTPIKLYDEYRDLYLTYYFTNISLLLGICLLIRYMLYYISI